MNFDSNVLNIAIEDIIPNRMQPRLVFDDDALKDLAASIKTYGIIQPLVLRRIGEKYEIIAGERRYKAAKIAGLTSVPAVLARIDDKKSAEVAIAENVQRKELNPIEEAKSYEALLKVGFMSKEMFAHKLGIPLSLMEQKLKLLTLPQEIQDALLANKISERHARSLMKLKEPNEQVKWLHEIIDNSLNVKDLEAKLSKEYGSEINGYNIDINKIKNEATDIKVPLIEPIENMGSMQTDIINLGTKKENRFFNDLEDEKANMSFDETKNPFTNSYLNFNSVITPKEKSNHEDIDSLDFLPPNSN